MEETAQPPNHLYETALLILNRIEQEFKDYLVEITNNEAKDGKMNIYIGRNDKYDYRLMNTDCIEIVLTKCYIQEINTLKTYTQFKIKSDDHRFRSNTSHAEWDNMIIFQLRLITDLEIKQTDIYFPKKAI